MAALTANRNTPKVDDPAIPRTMALPMKAGAKVFGGSIVATDATGYAVPATAATGLRIWGRAKNLLDNTTGANGTLTIEIDRGAFPFNVNADTTITQASIGVLVYATDDNTVSTVATARSLAGMIIGIQGAQVQVLLGAGPQTSGGTLGG